MRDQTKIDALERKLKWKDHELSELIAKRADDLKVPVADIELALDDPHNPMRPFPAEYDKDGELRRRWKEMRGLRKELADEQAKK